MAIGKLFTLQECSELTGHTVATWRAWVLHRKVPFYKIGRSIRIAESDLQSIIERSLVPALGGRR